VVFSQAIRTDEGILIDFSPFLNGMFTNARVCILLRGSVEDGKSYPMITQTSSTEVIENAARS
jgi:hypothetical protein